MRTRIALTTTVALGTLFCTAAAADRPSPSRLVTCYNQPFELSALSRPQNAQAARTAPARALRRFFRTSIAPPAWMMTRHGWRLLRTTAHRALYGLGDPPEMQTVLMVRRDGKWQWGGWAAGCQPRTVRDGLASSPWWLDPAHGAPGSGTRTLHVLVHDMSCSDSHDARGRVKRPAIWMGRDRIFVATYVTPSAKGGRCSFRPEIPATIYLLSPLAGRRLVDAGAVPWHRRL
jgi:hypothetical protein